MSYGHNAGASLLNSYTATPLTVDTTTTPSTYRISGLMPITKGDVVSVKTQAAVTEVNQEFTVGGAVTPTVTASTKYQLKIGNTYCRVNGFQSQLQNITYMSPSTLSGTAATDRQTMYENMADQINNNNATFASAYAIITILVANANNAFAANEIITQSVSGATGINIKTVTGAAAETGTGAVTLTIGVISGTFTAASAALTGSVTGTTTTATSTVTTGLGLRIIDSRTAHTAAPVASYFYPNTWNGGPNQVLMTAGFTIPSTMLVATTAGVVSYGQAAFLAAMVPVLGKDGNLASGNWEMATNNAPTTAKAYGKITIIDRPNTKNGGLGNQTSGTLRTQILYLVNDEADYAAAVTNVETMNNNAA